MQQNGAIVYLPIADYSVAAFFLYHRDLKMRKVRTTQRTTPSNGWGAIRRQQKVSQKQNFHTPVW